MNYPPSRLQSLLLLATALATPAVHAANPTTTTLTASAPILSEHQTVYLTAYVTENGSALTRGTVVFCKGPIPCTQVDTLGTAQLRAKYPAVLPIRLYRGDYSVTAAFVGIEAASASESSPVRVKVLPARNGDFIGSGGTVYNFGTEPVTGTVSWADASNPLHVYGTSSLGPAMPGAALYYHGNEAENPGGAISADLNQDGIPDLIDYAGQVFLGNGVGGFIHHSNSAGKVYHNALAADFNNDGNPDVLFFGAKSYGEQQTIVRLGDGKGGSFPASFPRLIFSRYVLDAAVGDFNHDGNIDIILLTEDSPSNGPFTFYLDFYAGDGHGHFAARVGTLFVGLSGSSIPGSGLQVADFNSDGFPDLMVPILSESKGVQTTPSIYLNQGNGTFKPGPNTQFAAAGGFATVVVADFNNDHTPDLAYQTSNSTNNSTLSVYLGQGDGTFKNPVTTSFSYLMQHAAVYDINHDGILDIADSYTNLLGNGDGTFIPQIDIGQGSGGNLLVDFNSDGILDVTDGANVSLGDLAYSPLTPPTYPCGMHQVIASYSGDALHIPSHSAVSTERGPASSSTTSLTVSPGTDIASGQTVQFTVNVSTSDNVNCQATGIVEISDGADFGQNLTLVNGQAVYSTNQLTSGVHHVAAYYGGDGVYATRSTSPTITITVK